MKAATLRCFKKKLGQRIPTVLDTPAAVAPPATMVAPAAVAAAVAAVPAGVVPAVVLAAMEPTAVADPVAVEENWTSTIGSPPNMVDSWPTTFDTRIEADEVGNVIDTTKLLAAKATVIALCAVYVTAETSVTKREVLNEVMSPPKVTCVERLQISAVNKAAEERATRDGAMQQQ